MGLHKFYFFKKYELKKFKLTKAKKVLAIDQVQVRRFRLRYIKALFILNIEKMNFFNIRSEFITFVGIDRIYMFM